MAELDRTAKYGVETDDPGAALREVRERFIASFDGRCDAAAHLAGTVAQLGQDGPVDALRQLVHRMAGLAGTIGFSQVSQDASAFEALLQDVPSRGLDHAAAASLSTRLRDAFAQDLQRPAPSWHEPTSSVRGTPKILLVEDDPDQARVVSSWLEQAGYETVVVSSGAAALPTMVEERPALVLLDVGLPDLDGYSVCRHIKGDPDLARTPVIFLTTRASLDDRLRGLALGADDYVSKPADERELLMRVQLRLKRPDTAALIASPANMPRQVLDYDAFVLVAHAELARHDTVALALVRVPFGSMAAVTRALTNEIRRRDVIGRFDRTHLVILLPELTATVARTRLDDILGRAGEQVTAGVHAGVTTATAMPTSSPSATLDALLAEADEALASARYHGLLAAAHGDTRPASGAPVASGTAVLAEDDPDVMQIVDATMRSAGLRTVLTFDGQRAIDAVQTERPDVLLLDLMMPKLSGFDVLQRLDSLDLSPHIVVLSARGREDDVTRAFELGADDYVTKPFSPQELLVRVTRLLR